LRETSYGKRETIGACDAKAKKDKLNTSDSGGEQRRRKLTDSMGTRNNMIWWRGGGKTTMTVKGEKPLPRLRRAKGM